VVNTGDDGKEGWTVNESQFASDSARVRIGRYPSGGFYDTSDIFVIQSDHLPPSITITRPQGVKTIFAQSTYLIEWEWQGAIDDVKIEWGTGPDGFGGEAPWSLVGDYVENDGEYEWTVPDTSIWGAMIRITDLNSGVSAISSGTLIIEPAIHARHAALGPSDIPTIQTKNGAAVTVRYGLAHKAETAMRVYDTQGRIRYATPKTIRPAGRYELHCPRFGPGRYILELNINGAALRKSFVLAL